MGFASGADMFRASAKNRKPNKERRTFGEISDSYEETQAYKDKNKLTPRQFERFKIELQQKRRIAFYKRAALLSVIVITVVTVFILLLR